MIVLEIDGDRVFSETSDERPAPVTWKGETVRGIGDRLYVGFDSWPLPGPAVDVEVVGEEIRVACVEAAVIWSGTTRVLPIPATAAGPVWGTVDGAIVDDAGKRVGAVPGTVTAIGRRGEDWLVGTHDGLYVVGRDTARVDAPGPCGSFITGIARWKGDLVLGTFQDGACVQRGEAWEELPLPSPMVNDVLTVGEVLYVATAEGLVRFGEEVEVFGEVGAGGPGMNHPGVNALAAADGKVWAVDVLGPVRVGDWRRYRWSVTGHSYQSVAACGATTWAGSEDDGIALTGLAVGTRNGRSAWRHFDVTDGLPEDWIMALACDGPRAAWVGTYSQGIGRIDASGWHPGPELPNRSVQALLVRGNALYVGTAGGLFVVEGGRVTRLSEDDVQTLYWDEDRLLVGTREGLR